MALMDTLKEWWGKLTKSTGGAADKTKDVASDAVDKAKDVAGGGGDKAASAAAQAPATPAA